MYGKVYILVVFSIVFEVVFILCGKIWSDREDEGLYRHSRNTGIQVPWQRRLKWFVWQMEAGLGFIFCAPKGL